MKNREIEKEIKFIEKDKKTTKLMKQKFINEIKNGLGDKILEDIKNRTESKPKEKGNAIINFFKRIFRI